MHGQRYEGRLCSLGLVCFRRIAPGIVPANQSLYKLEKQSGQESFRPTNPAETNKTLINKESPRGFIHHWLSSRFENSSLLLKEKPNGWQQGQEEEEGTNPSLRFIRRL
jgi:hypothetical protein